MRFWILFKTYLLTDFLSHNSGGRRQCGGSGRRDGGSTLLRPGGGRRPGSALGVDDHGGRHSCQCRWRWGFWLPTCSPLTHCLQLCHQPGWIGVLIPCLAFFDTLFTALRGWSHLLFSSGFQLKENSYCLQVLSCWAGPLLRGSRLLLGLVFVGIPGRWLLQLHIWDL